ncbi:MAG TPA: hypothetical protein VJ862_00615 [Rhodanobacteraceae bacterium]|nr:hypothetical protein [Rhodanobacteraceae bacterium]
MPGTPIIFKTVQRFRFSDLDPYNHMSTRSPEHWRVHCRPLSIRA